MLDQQGKDTVPRLTDQRDLHHKLSTVSNAFYMVLSAISLSENHRLPAPLPLAVAFLDSSSVTSSDEIPLKGELLFINSALDYLRSKSLDEIMKVPEAARGFLQTLLNAPEHLNTAAQLILDPKTTLKITDPKLLGIVTTADNLYSDPNFTRSLLARRLTEYAHAFSAGIISEDIDDNIPSADPLTPLLQDFLKILNSGSHASELAKFATTPTGSV